MRYGKFTFSQHQREEYKKKVEGLEEFCEQNKISRSASGKSYYFTLHGKNYRVSNHTIDASNRGAFTEDGEQIRDFYHAHNDPNLICIHAGRARLKEIYNLLEQGYELNGFGKIKADKTKIER